MVLFVAVVSFTVENFYCPVVVYSINEIAELRGEAYKLCNEDAVAAKWLNDYNALLDSFRQWLVLRQPNFGM